MSDDEDPVTKRPVDERDIFGDSDSELSSVVDSDGVFFRVGCPVLDL